MTRDVHSSCSELTEASIAVGTQFLSAFLFSLPCLTPIGEVGDKKIRKSIEYIRSHIQGPLYLEDLSELAGA